MAVIRVNGNSTSNFPTGGDVSGEVSLSSKSINDLSDVNTSGAANGKILIFNGTSNQFEIGDDTDTGIANVVEDTTPQLGGNLDLNSKDITGTGDISHTGTITTTGPAGTGDVVSILGDYTGSAGNVANAADVLVVTKKHNTSSRQTNIKFKSADGSSTFHNHSVVSRRTGTGVNDKFFQIFEHDDSNSAQPVELVRFKKNANFTTSNNLAELQMTGRINLTVSDADVMPNSNRTTVSMDGTTTTAHNMLTGMADFGSSSMTDGAEITFTGDITNDAIGGASSPRRIGQIKFHYGNTETDNQIELVSQEHDQTVQNRFLVDGHRAKVESKPIGLANLTTTQRNALTAANGDLIYNTTDSKIQAYAGGSWVNLH
tara:strand:+ start:778 stop:1896 length:1119 start_codon:yes stop_codon:yes gene_type:complete